MYGRFSRPKKIGKRSSASLFFTLKAFYCLQGQVSDRLGPATYSVTSACASGTLLREMERPSLIMAAPGCKLLDCLDCLGKAVSPVSDKGNNSLSLLFYKALPLNPRLNIVQIICGKSLRNLCIRAHLRGRCPQGALINLL